MAVLSTLQSTVEKPSHMEESDSESSHEDGDVDFEVKGQEISEGNCRVFNSHKKKSLWHNSLVCTDLY